MQTHRSTDLLLLAGLVLLALFPMFGSDFYTKLLVKIMLMGIFAMSLDLLVGFTGLVSLGHAAFFGISGYVVALMSPQSEAPHLWLSLAAAVGVSAAYALVTGALVLRTSGIYFIMVTLAFAQMAYFVFHDTELGGGTDGIYIFFKPEVKIGDWTLLVLEELRHFYFFVLGLMALVYLFLRRLLRSPFGHALIGIKVNEHRMRSLGFPTFLYKLAAYVIAGAIAGLAGFLFALKDGFVNPEILSWHQSGEVLMMVILGGMGTLHGPIIGALGFEFLHEFLANHAWFGDWAKHWQLGMGAIVILVALFLPQGLSGLLTKLRLREVMSRDDSE